MIFDDSTSAVDTATEKKIREALAKRKDVTKIIIAQRITSVMNTDQIVILEDGKVHCTGTHKELLAHDPIYQEIYKSQMRGVQENEIEQSAAKKVDLQGKNRQESSRQDALGESDLQENKWLKYGQKVAETEHEVLMKGGITDGSENLQR